MLLTLRTTHAPATDLGWLLHKRPDRAQTFELAFGQVHVLWPEATEAAATCAVLLDLDPVALVRGRAESVGDGPLAAYVNDRPYVASSFLSVALNRVFRSAMAGRCDGRPGLATTPIPLEATLAVLPCRGGEGFLRRLFEPLGYEVVPTRLPLDPVVASDGGTSSLFRVELRATTTVSALLCHLEVLVPVLDDEKHFWVGDDEVRKLVERGAGWLAEHPEREAIALRYLHGRRGLARAALRQLVPDVPADEEAVETARDEAEQALERPLSLAERRRTRVVEILRERGARRVADVGCGEGKLLVELLKDRAFEQVIGVEVSPPVLERCERRLKLDQRPAHWRERLTLLHGSLTYRDARLEGVDAVACVEVIEHLEPDRLDLLEAALFATGAATVVVTTPNAEYNVRFPGLPAGRFRHADHRFEWTRAQLRAWGEAVAARRGRAVRFEDVGDVDPEVGAPTQLAVFTR
jgi:3' terminal RNA ribose 2'-O-methyltransferase Hen1